MLSTSATRLLFFVGLASVATLSLVTACADDSAVDPDATDSGTDGPSKKKDSGGGEEEDGSVDPEKDAGTADADPGVVDGPGEAGTTCFFNRECQAALRCDCNEAQECFCQPGVRGTGKNGIDTCTSGNDCASSVCVDGPVEGESICSDECDEDTDCTGKLPRCIALGICARIPPQ